MNSDSMPGNKLLLISVLLGMLIFSGAVAAPRVTFEDPGLGLVKKSEIGSTNRGNLEVPARGEPAVSRLFATIGGVLLQQTATVSDNLKGRTISLSTSTSSDSGALLKVKIGKHVGVSDAPSWIWLNAANFANTNDTAAVTLYGKPETEDEKSYMLTHQPNYWVGYHPTLDDTLMGLMIFAADAIFVNSNPDAIRRITDGIRSDAGIFSKFREFDEADSAKASAQLRRILSERKDIGVALEKVEIALMASVIEGSTQAQNKLLKAQKKLEQDYLASAWNTYMLNDVDSEFEISIKDGSLEISGAPNYQFGYNYKERFFKSEKLTYVISMNRDILYDLNPIVFTSVDYFSKMVAFFNFVKQNHPKEWTRFYNSLGPLMDQVPNVDVPAAWSPLQ